MDLNIDKIVENCIKEANYKLLINAGETKVKHFGLLVAEKVSNFYEEELLIKELEYKKELANNRVIK